MRGSESSSGGGGDDDEDEEKDADGDASVHDDGADGELEVSSAEPPGLESPFPVDYQAPLVGKNPARRLRSSLLHAVDGDDRAPLLRKGDPISGDRNMCWARALTGETMGAMGDLLEVAEQVEECMLNLTNEFAKELQSAQTDSLVRGKLRSRTLAALGSEMTRQIRFMRHNATYCWSNDHYVTGVPHILVWARLKGRCIVVLEEGVKKRQMDPCQGYYATMYGQLTSRCLTEADLKQFLLRRRPQDRLVLMESWASMSDGGGHYSHHLTAVHAPLRSVAAPAEAVAGSSEHGAPLPPPLRLDDADCEGDMAPLLPCDMPTDELVDLMRRNAWASNAITGMMDQPKHLREVRENALAILARDDALEELEAAGMVPGSLVLFADFANGQDDAELLELIRGPVRQSYFKEDGSGRGEGVSEHQDGASGWSA